MKRSILVASLLLAFPMSASAHPIRQGRPCSRLFTVPMAQRAARAVYRGTRAVSTDQRRLLGRLQRCQRNPHARAFVRAFYGRQRSAWLARRTPPLSYAVASWYEDAGSTACGYHVYYGVANKSLPCGTHVVFSYGGRTVEATVDDRGPFISGRDWDLNQNTAAALGFAGVATVGYHY